MRVNSNQESDENWLLFNKQADKKKQNYPGAKLFNRND